MASEHQAASDALYALNGESHLLELPPELRKDIFDLVLALQMEDGVHLCILDKPRRPSLLQVCRQLRDESRLTYHEHTAFIMIMSDSHTKPLRRWAATLTADELGKTQSLSFRCVRLDTTTLRDFQGTLSDMIRRGLNPSALRVRASDNSTMPFAVGGRLYGDAEQAQG